MADFEDMTGWWEELQAYYEEGGQDAVDYIYRDGPEVWGLNPRLSQVQQYAELLLKDPELRDAVARQAEWMKVVYANGGAVSRGDPEWDNRPAEAQELIADLYEWYCLKSGYPHERYGLFGFGLRAARGVVEGKFESIRSKACVDMILDGNHVDRDEGSLS